MLFLPLRPQPPVPLNPWLLAPSAEYFMQIVSLIAY